MSASPQRPSLSLVPAARERLDEAEAFTLQLGVALHRYGVPSHRLEAALSQVAQRLGVTGAFFSMPTGLIVAFGDGAEQRTRVERVEPGELDLGKQGALDEVAREVGEGVMSPAEGARRIEAIVSRPPPYGRLTTTVAFAVASATAVMYLGGGFGDMLACLGIGVVISGLATLAGRSPSLGRLFEAAAALTCALLAKGLASLGLVTALHSVIVAGLIVLLPGLSLTTALNELAMRHLVAGTARLANACVVFVQLGFGVALGLQLGNLWPPAPAVALSPVPAWLPWVALPLAAWPFMVLFRARRRDLWPIVASGFLAVGGAKLGAALLGPMLGGFLGALMVGLGSNAWARYTRRPAASTLVPGLILLVPGSLGMTSLRSLLERNVIGGVETAFTMTLVAIALVAGLLIANALLPARRSL